eukprot:Gregarina_sp_Pseudo_9__1087@NODE_1708_length_1380_cov_17_184191_g1583_i0_p1_GENE_NODE_1708_length_1380_cov_17_184191_g1583_i0NODE_1708_length_1380_cov_17_184191_g1583_i0_p1_ORF_typecomplete_len291_score97_74NUDIX_2/PF13869_6/1_6e32_NODE_1708_length_1380_cov_17_184191_g1583_i04151287
MNSGGDGDGVRDPEWRLYPQQGYEVVTDETLKPVSLSPSWNETRRNAAFFKKGMRHTAAAVMLTHRWLSPHLLVFLKQAEVSNAGVAGGGGGLHCGLFSVKYKATDNPRQVLLDRLNAYLRPTSSNMAANLAASPSPGGDATRTQATMGEYIGTWWVATSSDYGHPLPYIPAHCTRPREMIRLYQVLLPPEVTFCVTPGYTLKSIPLFDLVVHRPALPTALQRIPFMMARFVFAYFEAGEDDEAVGVRSLHETASLSKHTPAAPAKKAPNQEDAQRSQVQLLQQSLNDNP